MRGGERKGQAVPKTHVEKPPHGFFAPGFFIREMENKCCSGSAFCQLVLKMDGSFPNHHWPWPALAAYASLSISNVRCPPKQIPLSLFPFV